MDRGSTTSVSRTESGLRAAGLPRTNSNGSLAASAYSQASGHSSLVSRCSQQVPIIMQTDDELRSSIIIEPTGSIATEAVSSPRASRGAMRLKRAKQVRGRNGDTPDLASFSVMSEGNESMQSSRSLSRKRVTLMASPRGLSISGLPSLLSPSVCDDERMFQKRPAYVLQPTERLSTLLAKVKEAIAEAGQEVITSRRESAAISASNGLSGATSAATGGAPEIEPEAAFSAFSTSCADLEADMMSKMDKKLDSSHPYEVYRGARESYNMLAHSMLCLNPFNPVRTCLFDCINSRWFENTTLVVIILNSITLAMDIPATEDNASLQDFLRASEYFFQAAFTVEMLMKAVALGFVHHPHAYLRSTWNCIDFLVVIGGFISFIGQANVSVLRLVRVVRPLRTISRVAGMRTIMNSIVMAIPSLLEVSVLISFLMITFAITGMGLFMEGWHERCHVVLNYSGSDDDDDFLPGEMWLVQTDTLPCGAGPACGPARNGVNFTQVCTTGEFHDDVLNFDNIGSALLLVFKVIALDDWPDDMLKAQKATSFWAFVYFVVLTLTGAYFCVNLILAILSSIFSTEADAQDLDAVQLGSMLFRSRGKDVAFDTAIALNPGGLNPPGAQPSNVLNPDPATKWTDLNAGDLIVQFVAPVKVDEYTFSTAKDAPQCDPVSWRLEGWCPRLSTWVTQHEVDNFDTPDERTVELPLFTVPRPQRYMRYRLVTTRRRLEESEDAPPTPRDANFFSSTGFTNDDDDECSPQPPRSDADPATATNAAGSLSGAPRGDACAMSTRSAASTAESRRSRHGSVEGEGEGEVGSALSADGSERDTHAGVCLGFRRGVAQRLRVVRGGAAHVVRHRVFGFAMLTVTVVNSVCMSIDYYGINKDTESWLYEVNHWCSLVFAVEMLVCLGALGFKEYFGDNFYAFDFLLVVLSMPNIVMTLRDGGSKGGVGRAMSAFRVFRLARVARIAERFSGLRLLLETILKSVMSVTYLFLIMLLFIFIFGVLGLQLFSNAYPDAPQRYPHDYGAAERSTFKSFPQSLLTVFVVITGESWAQIMKQGVRGTNASATVYFLLLFVLGHYVFLNLVIAILIYNFSEASGRTSDAREENERAHEFRRNQRRLSLIHRMMHSHRASIVFLMQHHSEALLPPPLSPISNPLIPPMRDFSAMDETQNSYIPSETGTEESAFPQMAPDSTEAGKCDLQSSTTTVKGSPIKGSPTLLARNMTVPALSSQRSSALRSYIRPAGRPGNYASKRDTEDVFGLSEGTETAEPIPLPTALRARALSAPVRTHASGEFADIRTEGEKTERELDNHLHLTGGTQLDAMSVLSEVMEGMQQGHKGPSLQGRSFGMFGHDHFLRVQASRVVLHKYFDMAVIPVILINVAVLSADSPSTDEDSVFNQVLTYADLAVTLLFVLEALLKTFVLGVYHTSGQTEDHFVLHPELGTPIPGYLNSVWNCIDMAVCLGSVASIWIKSMKSVKSIRAVRLIILSHDVRVLFLSLFTALPQMVYVCLVCSFVWLVFGILGVQLFKGSFYYCTDLSVSEEEACLEGTYFYAPKLGWNGTELTLYERKWVRTRYHFDDIGNAVLTLFEVALGEGWVRIMYTGVDASLGHGGVALEKNRHLALSLYFVAFVIIGGFFSLNLFVGMLIEQFGQVKAEKEGTAGLNESQRVWLNVCKVMNRTKLYRVPVVRYDNPVLHGISRLVRHPQFDNFIMGMIMVNLTFMSVSHKDEQENAIFMGLYALEAVLKIIGLGPSVYFMDNWYRFDFMLVILAVVGVVFSLKTTAMLVLRIARVFRLIKRAKSLEKLFTTLVYALPSLGNITVCVVVVFFVFGIVGVDLFGRITFIDNSALDADRNFRDLYHAIVLLFTIATTETWTDVMAGCMVTETNSGCSAAADCGMDCCGTPWAVLYFISFMLVGAVVVLNLFVTVLLDQFQQEDDLNSEESQQRMALFRELRDEWVHFDTDAKSKVSVSVFICILRNLPEDIQRRLGLMSRKDMSRKGRGYEAEFLAYLSHLDVPVVCARNDDGERCVLVDYSTAQRALGLKLFRVEATDAEDVEYIIGKAVPDVLTEFRVGHYAAVRKLVAGFRKLERRRKHSGEHRALTPAESQTQTQTQTSPTSTVPPSTECSGDSLQLPSIVGYSKRRSTSPSAYPRPSFPSTPMPTVPPLEKDSVA